MRVNAAELIPTRATLLERLKNLGDQASWREFFEIYWKLIYCVARKAGLSEVEAQDAVQETLIAVAKQMPTFKYDPALGSFKAFLLKTSRWRIVDQFRKRGPMRQHHKRSGGSRTSTGTATIESMPDPAGVSVDQLLEAEWQNNLLEAAMHQVKRRIDPQRYQIFDCYANRGWAAPKVAATFGVSVEQVYVAKCRITQLVKDEVARLEKEYT